MTQRAACACGVYCQDHGSEGGCRYTSVWLREVDAGTDNACWVVCARGDRGARRFIDGEKETSR